MFTGGADVSGSRGHRAPRLGTPVGKKDEMTVGVRRNGTETCVKSLIFKYRYDICFTYEQREKRENKASGEMGASGKEEGGRGAHEGDDKRIEWKRR